MSRFHRFSIYVGVTKALAYITNLFWQSIGSSDKSQQAYALDYNASAGEQYDEEWPVRL